MINSQPSFDLYVDNEEKVVAKFYTPGFTKDKLMVKFNNGYLAVRGTRETSPAQGYIIKSPDNKPTFYAKLFVGSAYEPEDATYLDGILQVTMRKVDTEDGAIPIS